MYLFEKEPKILSSGPLAQFPNGHIFAVTALCALLLCFTLFPSDNASAKRQSQSIAIPQELLNDETADLAQLPDNGADPSRQLRVIEEEVRAGDNLSAIFKRAGLNDRQMMALLNGNPKSKKLASLYPGHSVAFGVDTHNELQQLTYTIDKLNSFSFSKTEQGYQFGESIRQPDVRLAQASGTIEQSLYAAGLKARMDDRLIMELAEIFGWDIDFALDIRRGDTFKLIFEERFLDGEKIGNGAIVAAEFVNQGEKFQAVRYVTELGEASYYTPTGENMRKAFLRAPLDFRRISSNFDPRRLHPIFKKVKPHRGTDYVAPVGTPVWASGAGKVVASGYSKANGNYVFIQHGNNIETKYLHLQKRFVKRGQKVKQKQKIGTLGATGYATGAHLHYEFLLNGVHRNPRTIVGRLPKAKSINPVEMARFVIQTRPYIAELNIDTPATRYAQADADASGSAKL